MKAKLKLIAYWAPLFAAVFFCGGFAVTQSAHGRRLDSLEGDRKLLYEMQTDIKVIRTIIEERHPQR